MAADASQRHEFSVKNKTILRGAGKRPHACAQANLIDHFVSPYDLSFHSIQIWLIWTPEPDEWQMQGYIRRIIWAYCHGYFPVIFVQKAPLHSVVFIHANDPRFQFKGGACSFRLCLDTNAGAAVII